jgi:transposase
MVPAEHPARVVDAVADNLDISELECGYKGGGTSSYDPRALLKVIIYSYLTNVYSGRQMAKLWNENIVYMWLGGRNVPNFRTINNFRSRRLLGTFDSLFTQVVLLLHDEDLESLKVQYVDGTKIESAANKYTFVWRKVDQTKEMEAATLCKKEGNPYFWVTLKFLSCRSCFSG